MPEVLHEYGHMLVIGFRSGEGIPENYSYGNRVYRLGQKALWSLPEETEIRATYHYHCHAFKSHLTPVQKVLDEIADELKVSGTDTCAYLVIAPFVCGLNSDYAKDVDTDTFLAEGLMSGLARVGHIYAEAVEQGWGHDLPKKEWFHETRNVVLLKGWIKRIREAHLKQVNDPEGLLVAADYLEDNCYPHVADWIRQTVNG